MADPVTLSLVAAGTAVASTVASTYGQYQQAKSQEKMAQYQADVAENNRKTVLAQGVQEESRMRRMQRRRIGAQRAGLAEAGVFGRSSFDLLEESMINAEMDILNTRAQAAQQGANFLQQAQMKRFEGRQFGNQARMALVQGGINLANSAAQAGSRSGGSF